MAANIGGILNEELRKCINSCKLLVVGAGGIGCELLKNLVLTGFIDIELIDLDTIDVSNLNRQFLFRKEHVGKSKAQVAKQSVLQFNPDAKIQAYHDSIMDAKYGVDFFQRFNLVLNALDNRAARNHVNRMCLAANRPLIESGSAGYLGQVTVIKKGLTECYECQPKPPQKTFPGCTIRNTPSEPIHCIVWAKHLFNQLFGEDDPDQDVSPDTEDPELAAEAGQTALQSKSKSDATGGIERKSTRAWAQESGYDTKKLFFKFFCDDIKYLLSMENLWKKRRPPTPLDWDNLPSTETDNNVAGIRDQRIWSIQECANNLHNALAKLKIQVSQQGDNGILVWDKDDDAAMDFVTSAANIRAYIFGIPPKSRFDIKSMAGNIIPAIATTNAIIAGLLVMEALKVISGQLDKCRTVYLNRQPNPRKKLLVPCVLDKPNPKCYVCSDKPQVTVRLNTDTFTVKALEDNVLKTSLGMVAPDVEIDDGKGTILISSEEGETEENGVKPLSVFGIGSGSVLKCDDFVQVYTLNINILHVETLPDDKEFEIIGDVSELQTQAEIATAQAKAADNDDNGYNHDSDDDLVLMDEDVLETSKLKRKADVDEEISMAKRAKLAHVVDEGDDDVVVL